jgi:hypothetical protein
MKTSDLLDHADSFEHRLSVGLEHIADAGSVPGPGRFDPDVLLVDRASDPRSSRWLVGAAAAAVVVLGVGGLIVANRQDADPAPAQQPSSAESASPTPTLEAPVWYGTIRPLLPDGFDQIVLTDATQEVVGFKAFRTGTRQLLDVTITLQSGYGMKDTGEAATFSDDYGDYTESAGSVALTTPDQRQVIIRCGLRPIGGGSVETGGLLDADRDTCEDGFDNLDIDTISRRSLAARLATEFPTNIVTPAFGQPDTSPVPADVAPVINDFVGEDRPFGGEQARGVLRDVNLSPVIGEASTTELTVIQGMWPPNGDGSALDDIYAGSPQGRFHLYDDIAVALVVVDTTGYHIATADLSDTHLTALGELLNQVIEETSANAPTSTAAVDQTDPGSSIATIPEVSTTTIVTSISNELTEALRPDGRVLVVNATRTAGLGGSLSQALADSGYDVLDPTNAADGTIVDESIMYLRADTPWPGSSYMMAPNAIMNAVPIGRMESLSGQPTPAVNQEMVDSADIIIVVGTDLAGAPWQKTDTPLFTPGIGRLLIIDATTNDRGRRAADEQAQDLRAAGVDVAGIVAAAKPVEETMLMPIGQSTPWTFAIAELAAVGGFDTWNPSLITEPIPDGVTAALVIGDIN